MENRVYLACIGLVDDINNASGTPYFLLHSLKKLGVNALDLQLQLPKIYPIQKIFWNLKLIAKHHKYGGFQFSEEFLNYLWLGKSKIIQSLAVINCFQLYPNSIIENNLIEKWFYIDQTLKQCMLYYNGKTSIDDKILERERNGYESACGIIVHSNWVKECLINNYRIPENKIFIVVPGANISEWPINNGNFENSTNSLKLIFVGKDYKRKGLDRLIIAINYAKNMGANIELSVIGCYPDYYLNNISKNLNVTWYGYIDKKKDWKTFSKIMLEADIGCLLSKNEAGGMSIREFHAFGLAVLAPKVGGSPEHAIKDAAIFIDPNDCNEKIAKLIYLLWNQRLMVNSMKMASKAKKHTVSWDVSAYMIKHVMGL